MVTKYFHFIELLLLWFFLCFTVCIRISIHPIIAFYIYSKAMFSSYFVIVVRPKFTDHKMKSFMVVKAGNSVRITLHFEVRFIAVIT